MIGKFVRDDNDAFREGYKAASWRPGKLRPSSEQLKLIHRQDENSSSGQVLYSHYSFIMLNLLYVAYLTPLALYRVSALPTPSLSPPRLVYQFPHNTWVENIASRGNGNLLLSTIGGSGLYTIDPTASEPTPKVAFKFPDTTATFGIKETGIPDVFVVITGNYSNPGVHGVYGSFSVWSIDFRENPPVGAKIASIPDTDFLNGLAIIRAVPNILYLADTSNNALRTLNTRTGESRIVLRNPMFVNSSTIPLGINGIETFGRDLYFTNAGKGIYGKIPTQRNGSVVGTVEQIASLESPQDSYDDFTFDKHGNALLAVHPSAVNRVTPSGEQSVLLGGPGSSDFAAPTSIVFGRGCPKEEATLYVTTGGIDPISGKLGGGQVIAIDNYRSR